MQLTWNQQKVKMKTGKNLELNEKFCFLSSKEVYSLGDVLSFFLSLFVDFKDLENTISISLPIDELVETKSH